MKRMANGTDFGVSEVHEHEFRQLADADRRRGLTQTEAERAEAIWTAMNGDQQWYYRSRQNTRQLASFLTLKLSGRPQRSERSVRVTVVTRRRMARTFA